MKQIHTAFCSAVILFLLGCQSKDYLSFPSKIVPNEIEYFGEKYYVEVRFPWDEPIARIYHIEWNSREEITGGRIDEISYPREIKTEAIDSRAAADIANIFHDFDWNNPEDADVILLVLDDFLVSLKAFTPYSEKEVIIGFSSSKKTENLLMLLGILKPVTPNKSEQATATAAPVL